MAISTSVWPFSVPSHSAALTYILWAKILDSYREFNPNDQQILGFSLRWKAYREDNIKIIVFITTPIWTKAQLQEAEFVSSTPLNGHFSIHVAITLFAAQINDLLQLNNRYRLDKPQSGITSKS